MGCGSRRRSRGGSGWGSRRCEVWRRCGVGWRRGVASGGDAVWRRVETRCGVGWRRGARRLAAAGRGTRQVPRDGGPSRRGGCSALVGFVVTLSCARGVGVRRTIAPPRPPRRVPPPASHPCPAFRRGGRLGPACRSASSGSRSRRVRLWRRVRAPVLRRRAFGARVGSASAVVCRGGRRSGVRRPAFGVGAAEVNAYAEPVLRDMLVRAGHCSRRQAGRSRSPRRKAGHGWDAGGGPRRGGRGGASSSRCRSRLRMTG
jgi:hypothetical protein